MAKSIGAVLIPTARAQRPFRSCGREPGGEYFAREISQFGIVVAPKNATPYVKGSAGAGVVFRQLINPPTSLPHCHDPGQAISCLRFHNCFGGLQRDQDRALSALTAIPCQTTSCCQKSCASRHRGVIGDVRAGLQELKGRGLNLRPLNHLQSLLSVEGVGKPAVAGTVSTCFSE